MANAAIYDSPIVPSLRTIIAVVRENPLYVYLLVAILLAFGLVIAGLFATILW